MSHIHSVTDSDARFTINPITRQIRNDSSRKTTLIQYDHNSERFTFELPRYVEGHDMSLCTKVEVHYFNIDPKTKEERSGLYTADDFRICPDNEDAVLFSWLISQNGTKLAGILKFFIRYKCEDENKVVRYSWNTAFFTGISVGESGDAGEAFETEYIDVIEQWQAKVIQAITDDVNANVSAWAEMESGKVRGEMTSFSAQWNEALSVERARIDAITAVHRKHMPKVYQRFVYPNGFAGAYRPVGIYWDGENFITDFNANDWKYSGGNTFYVSVGGNYLNDGLSREAPIQLYQAINRAADGDTIIITEGVYSIGDLPLSEYNLARNVNIIGEGDVVLAPGSRIYSDFVKDTATGLWSAEHPVPIRVLNLDNVDIALSAAHSVENCISTTASYYHDGKKLYINTEHDPNGRLMILYETIGFNCINGANCRLYMENITIIGGASNFQTNKSPDYDFEIILNGCTFLYALYDRAAVRFAGGNVLLVNCKVAYARDDGFGYVAYNADNQYVVTNFVEINCIGANNGLNADVENKNGSTAHSGIKGIRVNGLYYNNNGGNVADVQKDTQTVNLGCEAYDSAASDASQGFGLQQAGTTMWLYNCKARGNNADLVAYGDTTAHIHNCHFGSVAGGGTIIQI